MPLIYNNGVRPWDGVGLFSQHARELRNEASAEISEFSQMKKQLHRLVATPETPSEAGAVQASFPVIIQGTLSVGWPKEYDWAESQLVGSGQDMIEGVLSGGRSSTDTDDDDELLYGLGINKIELLTGFGDIVGPYGQLLSDQFLTLMVQPISPGSPATMILRKNASDITVPIFEAYNPMTSACNVGPGVPPVIIA